MHDHRTGPVVKTFEKLMDLARSLVWDDRSVMPLMLETTWSELSCACTEAARAATEKSLEKYIFVVEVVKTR